MAHRVGLRRGSPIWPAIEARAVQFGTFGRPFGATLLGVLRPSGEAPTARLGLLPQ
jgi:hypothetical protein